MVWDKVTDILCEYLKNNKLTCYSQRKRHFTNNVKISGYNQLKTVLDDNVFSDIPVGTPTADELNCFC